MKEKQECKVCGRDMTPNQCSTHKNTKIDCYYCHLLKEHIEEYKPEADKTPTSTKKEKKETTFADEQAKVDDVVKKSKPKMDKVKKESQDRPQLESEDEHKESKNEFGFSRNKDDDRGLYS